MEGHQYKWVWVHISDKRKLAFVLEEREHSVRVNMYDEVARRLNPIVETYTKRVLSPTNFDENYIRQLPCGKRPLSINRAKMIVALNAVFKDNERRHEKRVYYCRKCQAFHTTARTKLPYGFLKKLAENPYKEADVEYYNQVFYRKRIWHWWHDNLGVKISFGLFEAILSEYDPDPVLAVRRIKAEPLDFMNFVQTFIVDARIRKASQNK